MYAGSLVRVGSLILVSALTLGAPRGLAAPFDPAPLRNKGAALLDNGDDAKAIEIFRDLVKRLPSSATDRVNLGIALLNHNDLDAAETELRKALALDPRDLRAHYNLGIVLKHRGRNEEAAAELVEVVSTSEGAKDASVHYNLGILYKRLRRNDEALESFRSAVALRPEHASAHFQIYNAMVQKGDKAKAQPELDLFKVLQKATPDFQRTEAFLERGAFTKVAAPGPDGDGEKGNVSEASASGAGAVAVSIRFESRSAAGPGREGEDGQGDGSKGTGRSAAVLADFDGDGSVDLAVADGAGGVRILRQSPPGVFPSIPRPKDGSSARGAAAQSGRILALAAGDADNDGDLDLAATDEKGVRLLLNDGKGSFSDATRGSGLEGAGGALDLLWLDADRDGDLDLVLGGGGANDRGPRIYLNASALPAPPGRQTERASGKGSDERTPASGRPAGKGAREGGQGRPSGGAAPRFLPAGPEAVLPACGEALAFSDLRGRDDPDVAFVCADGAIHVARNLRAGRFQSERVGAAASATPASSEGGARTDSSAPSGMPSPADRSLSREIRAADLDGDGRNDLVILAGGSLSVLWGEAEGRLARPTALLAGLPRGLAALAVLDADGDGDLDLATLVSASSPSSSAAAAASSSGSGSTSAMLTSSAERVDPSARAADVPGSMQKGRLWVLRNEGNRRFARVSDAAPDLTLPATAGALLTADVDRDGDPDLVAPGRPGTPAVSLLNVTKSTNRFLRIALTGGKSNRFGVGAKVEVRVGRLVVRREYDGGPLLVGVGARGRVDAVQIVWPTGISQDLVDVPATTLRVEEKREFAGSCPFLYVQDETGFRFLGEALSGAPIGFLRPDGLLEEPRPVEHLRLPAGLPVVRDGRLSIRLTEEMRELTALDSVLLVGVDHPLGTEVYSNDRLREPQEPFRYVVLKDLVAPNAAAEVILGTNEAETGAVARTMHEGRLRERGPAPSAGPSRAGSDRARSLPGDGDEAVLSPLEAVRLLDDRAPDGFASLGPRLEGYAVPHALVLRFDGVSEPDPPEALALVIDGWVSWSTSDVSRALFQAGQARRLSAGPAVGDSKHDDEEHRAGLPSFAGRSLPEHLGPWGPAVELRLGGARADEPDLGLPQGPSMVAPLPRIFAPRDPAKEVSAPALRSVLASNGGTPLEVRIGSNQTIYYDRVRLGRIIDVPLEIHELPPVAADLRWRGVASSRRHADARPPRPDYQDVSPLSPFARLREETTPEGDVLGRVVKPDGVRVIFGTGEEVAVDFDASALPPPSPGLTRTWFLVSRGYARDGDPNTEPLPWRD